MSSVPQRQPRFQRSTAPAIEIGARDLLILSAVFQYRFLTASLLHRLLGGSKEGITRRLTLLWQHGFLDRPRVPWRFRPGGGSLPIPHALGNQGAAVLSLHYPEAFVRGKVDWTEKNRITDPKYIPHTLGIAEVLVALTTACRESDAVRFINYNEIIEQAPAATRERENPSSWSVPLQRKGREVRRRVVPDALLGLQFVHEPEGRNRVFFFLEVDRATEPVHRRDDTTIRAEEQSSFVKKLALYFTTAKLKLHTANYGIKNFRVLVVTTSAARVENLIQANRAFNNGQGSRLFYFTTLAEIEQSENILTHPWQNGRNETVTLLD
jgi:hypothetical protein